MITKSIFKMWVQLVFGEIEDIKVPERIIIIVLF